MQEAVAMEPGQSTGAKYCCMRTSIAMLHAMSFWIPLITVDILVLWHSVRAKDLDLIGGFISYDAITSSTVFTFQEMLNI